MKFESDTVPQKADGETTSQEKLWGDLLFLQNERRPLNELYAEAEKLVQYYVAAAEEKDVRWLRAHLETVEREEAAALAARPDDPARRRAHAVLSGALSGLLYPLGRSPQDLNRMAF